MGLFSLAILVGLMVCRSCRRYAVATPLLLGYADDTNQSPLLIGQPSAQWRHRYESCVLVANRHGRINDEFSTSADNFKYSRVAKWSIHDKRAVSACTCCLIIQASNTSRSNLDRRRSQSRPTTCIMNERTYWCHSAWSVCQQQHWFSMHGNGCTADSTVAVKQAVAHISGASIISWTLVRVRHKRRLFTDPLKLSTINDRI